MQLLALRTQDRIIGDLANQVVGKFVFRRRQPLQLDQEIQNFQRPKPALQLRRRHAGHRRQQGRRNSRSDDGGKLEQGLVLFRQAIDARRDHPLHGGGNFQRLPGRLRGKPAGIAVEDAAMDELPRDFFDEQRHLAGVAKNMAP